MSFYLDDEAAEGPSGEPSGEGYLSEEVPISTPPRRKRPLPSLPSRHQRIPLSSGSDSESENQPSRQKKKDFDGARVLEEVKQTNLLVVSLIEKVKKTERRVRSMEEQLKS